MERHEIKALVDARLEEGKRTLDAMQAKAGAATGEVDAEYRAKVAQLKQEHDELKVRAAHTLGTTGDALDSGRKDFELALDDWEGRAKSTWHALQH